MTQRKESSLLALQARATAVSDVPVCPSGCYGAANPDTIDRRYLIYMLRARCVDGPALLSALEYIGLMYGIVVLPGGSPIVGSSAGLLQWSAVSLSATSTITAGSSLVVGNFSQTLGDQMFTQTIGVAAFSGARNASPLFEATRGVRVLSDIATGAVLGVVGISPHSVELTLTIHTRDEQGAAATAVVKGTVAPNTEYSIDGGKLTVQRQVPFAPPPPSV